MKTIFLCFKRHCAAAMLITFLLFAGMGAAGQTTLYGLTTAGGSFGKGVLFGLKSDGSSLQDLVSFGGGSFMGGLPPVEYNGKLYGLSSGSENSILYAYDPATANFEIKYVFSSSDDGMIAPGGLTVLDGKLYGMTQSGGLNPAYYGGFGTLFEFDPETNIYTRKIAFTGYEGDFMGVRPTGTLTAYNGKLYGTTNEGGAEGTGNFFEYDPSNEGAAAYSVKYDFSAYDNIGATPQGELTAFNGKIYGITSTSIFEFDPQAGSLVPRINFTGSEGDYMGNGSNSPAGLTIYNNRLYGTSYYGGIGDNGLIYEFDPSKTDQESYTVKAMFTGAEGDLPGSNPYGSLAVVNDRLYGVATNAYGGDQKGYLFELDPSGSGSGVVTNKLAFTGATGDYPVASAMGVIAFNNKLFGTSTMGGDGDRGVLYETDPADPAGTFTKRLDYIVSLRLNKGVAPGGRLLQYKDNLYGMTYSGGANDLGVIFEYNITSGTYNKRYEFDGTNGKNPYGSLSLLNDKLYGITSDGVIFEFDPSKSDPASFLKKTTTGNGTTGPSRGSLTVYNGKLYGMTSGTGSADGFGTLFVYDPELNDYKKLFDFTENAGAHRGAYPYGSLIVYNQKLYGLTSDGGTGYGTIFEYSLLTGDYKYYGLKSAYGNFPFGDLTLLNGKLYGLTSQGGSKSGGTLFEFDPATGSIASEYAFERIGYAASVGGPMGSLCAYNNKLYGLTSNGGNERTGSAFSFDPSNNSYTKLGDFQGQTGEYPLYTQLLVPGLQTEQVTLKDFSVTYGAIDFLPVAISDNPDVPVAYAITDSAGNSNTVASLTQDGKVHIKHTGTAYIIVSQEGDATHQAATTIWTKLTVKKAPLTVTAHDTTRAKGEPNPVFNYTLQGFVNGENASVLTTPISFTSAATENASQGSIWDIAGTAGTAENYELNFINGKLTITGPLPPQTISFNAISDKTYGDPDFNPGATSSSALAVIYESSDPAIAAIVNGQVHLTGAGIVVITARQPGGGTFAHAAPVSQTVTVQKAALIVIPDNKARVREQPNPILTASYKGFVNNDDEGDLLTPPSFNTNATQTSAAGSYYITAAEAASDNYTITYKRGVLSVLENGQAAMDAWYVSNGNVQVRINASTAQKVTVILYSMAGQRLYVLEKQLAAGVNQYQLPAGNLAAGVYIVKVKGEGFVVDQQVKIK